jgi:AAA15 family ATPase/GTPase
MIRELRVKNFKSWEDTGQLRLAPLTVFFGTNSSGKTSILQLLLLLKQTIESMDRKLVLRTGDDISIVDLGKYSDLIYCHNVNLKLDISLSWELQEILKIKDPEKKVENLFEVTNLTFQVDIEGETGIPTVRKFTYSFDGNTFGMDNQGATGKKSRYKLISKPYQAKRKQAGRAWLLPSPTKFYGFPDEVKTYYQNVGFLSDFVLELEGLFSRRMAYIGPLRDYPKRIYTWAGEEPPDVGRKGELTVAAILAAGHRGKYISPGYHKKKRTLEERIAYWLKEMGIIDSFLVEQIATGRKEYEVKIRKTKSGPDVLITDVGFGLSQVLPVLVLPYYVKKGSTLLLEQPELHLHPSAQSWLADAFIDVVNNLNVQLIVESHSEHFLLRLLRRIAEEKISVDKTALYFCKMQNSSSKTEKLDVDLYGDVKNWPPDFFGDEMGELTAKIVAAMKRQTKVG